MTFSKIMDKEGNILPNYCELKAARSICVFLEWGMPGFKSSFPCLWDTIRYEEDGEQKFMLFCFILLYNYHVSTVEFSEIQDVYMKFLKENNEETDKKFDL